MKTRTERIGMVVIRLIYAALICFFVLFFISMNMDPLPSLAEILKVQG